MNVFNGPGPKGYNCQYPIRRLNRQLTTQVSAVSAPKLGYALDDVHDGEVVAAWLLLVLLALSFMCIP